MTLLLLARGTVTLTSGFLTIILFVMTDNRNLREPEDNTAYWCHQVAARLSRRINQAVAAAGHPLHPAHAAVFINIDRAGSRLTQLAAAADVTPQSMLELVDELDRLGYLKRVPDPTDRRAKLITLTDAGYDALQAAFDAIITIEVRLEELLGRTALVRLRKTLRTIATDA
jgi:DNA-binding MarR family transcriptional regulator